MRKYTILFMNNSTYPEGDNGWREEMREERRGREGGREGRRERERTINWEVEREDDRFGR